MGQFNNGEGLTNLVRHKYQREMLHDARFKNTIDVALSGSTDDDVLALLVAGLAASCRDAAYLRDEMVQVIERHGGMNPQATTESETP
jgi:endonuclease III